MSIGHYLLSLTPEQEDLVLGTAMGPRCYFRHRSEVRGPCLVGVANGQDATRVRAYYGARLAKDYCMQVQYRFDALCDKHGVERTTRLIRNRILANRVRRTLKGVPQAQHA